MGETLYDLLRRVVQSATSPMTEQSKAELEQVINLLEEYEITNIELLREVISDSKSVNTTDTDGRPDYHGTWCQLCGNMKSECQCILGY